MYHVYDICISEEGAPYMVVNLSPDKGGPTDRAAAIAFAQAEAARVGWTNTEITRVARTPSGGYSVSINRWLKPGAQA